MSVDGLMEEVARLKAELTHQSALWQTALGHAAEQDAEIKHWRGEAEMYKGCRAALAELNPRLDAMRTQRDALADALREYVLDHDTGDLPAVEQDECACQRCIKARAALRLAGRLPQLPTEERTQE